MNIEFLRKNREYKISGDMSKRILCLPIFTELEEDVQDIIISTIKGIV